MADLKSAWPYIRFITLAEKASYVSDLPSDMDTFEVRPLAASPIFTFVTHEVDFTKSILNSEQRAEENQMELNTAIWTTLYITTLGLGLRGMSGWYYTDGIRNFLQFRHENWPAYMKRRLWPGLAAAWTVWHFLGESSFASSYPRLIA
jgi:hypothetical protein